ncbi:MAG: FAD-binding protein [Vicingaceae bacterium]
MIQKNYDIVVLGAGIAGLALAKYVLEGNSDLTIAILAKGELDSCNTSLAQGGMAAVTDFNDDSFERHVEDTFQAGGKVGTIDVIRRVVCDAPARLNDLVRWGVNFDRHHVVFRLHREGGHSKHRIVHHLDESGKAIHRTLLAQLQNKAPNVDFFSRYMGVELACEQNRCSGLFALNESEELVFFKSKAVILCGGGNGALFARTTNSPMASGDAVVLAARKGARIKDLHKVQFHPTALYLNGEGELPLISEAVRGFGAHLLNHKGERFAFKYDGRGELAARDVLSAAIDQEMKANNADYLFLSIKHLDKADFKEHFPNILNTCLKHGFDPFENDLPIVPAAHYQCGGINVDEVGHTSIQNLFAIGECAHTGLHGNNRLASNSLLEALAYAYYASNAILDQQVNENPAIVKFELLANNIVAAFDGEKLIRHLQSTMSQLYYYRKDWSMLNVFEKEIQGLQQSYHFLFLLPNKLAQEIRNRLDLAELFLEGWKAEVEVLQLVE